MNVKRKCVPEELMKKKREKRTENTNMETSSNSTQLYVQVLSFLQIPTTRENPADEYTDDASEGDSSGEHGAEKRAFFAFRDIFFFFVLVRPFCRQRGGHQRRWVFYFNVFVFDFV